MISPVWRYTLENFPIKTIGAAPMSTIIRTFLQEEGVRGVRIDVSEDGTAYDVFVINPSRSMPKRTYEALGSTRVSVATEVVHPLPVKDKWVTANVTWEGPGFRIVPTPRVSYPKAMEAPGRPCAFELLLAVCRPNANIAARERRTDITDLGPRWVEPHIAADGRGLYTWFQFIHHHGVQRGALLWDLGDKPIALADVAGLEARVAFDRPLAALSEEGQRIVHHYLTLLHSIPGSTKDDTSLWSHSGPCGSERVRLALRCLDDLWRLAPCLSGSLDEARSPPKSFLEEQIDAS
jgi:hypothetical protein